MPALESDMFQKVGRSTATTLSAPGYTIGNTSINVGSTSNWPTDTGITFAIDEVTVVDGEEVRTAGTYNIFRGTVASGTSVNNLTYVGGDANRNYSAGALTRVYILVSYYRENRMVDGILVDHSQLGAHEIAANYDPSNPTLETQKWAGVASAVNEITVTNAATGNFPTISATGEADTGIDFENSEGEEILKLDAIASAVNEVTIKNAATGNGPEISATGGDSNIDLNFAPKGTGKLKGVVNNLHNPYKFMAYKTATQSVGTAATKVQFETEEFDTGGNYDNATNYRFTAPVAGFYFFECNVTVTSVPDQQNVALNIYVNGSFVTGTNQQASAANDIAIGATLFYPLAATDYVEVFVSTSGAARNLLGVSGGVAKTSHFSGFLVSAT